ncbi:unnamed protein product [Schistosoma margrebowiei]|uniref:DUF7041 domain-containing protein n=1 Tax=Schistosoma margrebowiei TaxID=48269 RepID=A0A3P8FNX6_9TREM|nr:unnamed protein product [Schistosoma margrebowiei]
MTPKVFKIKAMSPHSFQLMPFWPDNIEAWFCYAEADFHEHGVNDTLAQFLAVVKVLPRKFNRYVTSSMFTSDVSEPHETLKRSILKQENLTDRQRLDQIFNNIDLQHGSATEMLQRMKEVIGLRTFDEGLFKQLFLSKLPQQVQAVLISFRNNALDELAASADRVLEMTKSSTTEVFSVKEKPQTTQNDITELCHTLTHYLVFVTTVSDHAPYVETFHVSDLSLDHERRITPTGAGIITSLEILPEIAENTAIFPSQNRLTRKTTRETSKPARVNGDRSRRT